MEVIFTYCMSLTINIYHFSLNVLLTVHIVYEYQHSETNVMYILCYLLRIQGLYIFQALPAHPQEVLYTRHLVYCMRVKSVGCTRVKVEP
jgi:hypothetical protein